MSNISANLSQNKNKVSNCEGDLYIPLKGWKRGAKVVAHIALACFVASIVMMAKFHRFPIGVDLIGAASGLTATALFLRTLGIKTISYTEKTNLPLSTVPEEQKPLQQNLDIQQSPKQSTLQIAQEIKKGYTKSHFKKLTFSLLLLAGGIAALVLAKYPTAFIIHHSLREALFVGGVSVAGAAGIGIGYSLLFKNQKLEYLASAAKRGKLSEKHCKAIQVGKKQIFLSSLPNKKHSDLDFLKENNVKYVLSIITKEELQGLGEDKPYLPEDYKNEDITNYVIYVEDHALLSPNEMNEAAEFINHALTQNNGQVLVHCRAGQGRSATAVAAYAMKYEYYTNSSEYSAQRAINAIKKGKPKATIQNKRKALHDFHEQLTQGKLPNIRFTEPNQVALDAEETGCSEFDAYNSSRK